MLAWACTLVGAATLAGAEPDALTGRGRGPRPDSGPGRGSRSTSPSAREREEPIRTDGESGNVHLDAFETRGTRGRFGLGVGVGMRQSPYEKGSWRAVPLPFVSYKGKRFGVTGPMLRIRVGDVGPMAFEGRLRYSFEGFEADDAERLRGMKTRHGTLMAGGATRCDLPGNLFLALAVETDVLNEHGGQRGFLALSYRVRRDRWTVTPELGAEWLSADTAAHLYGVPDDEAEAGRRAYRPGHTLSGRLGLGIRYTLSDSVAVIGNGGITFFDSAISNSPIVVRETVFGGFLAVAYFL